MAVLKADNRQLTKDREYSYLSNNYASGVSSIDIVNGGRFTAEYPILIGEFGQETAEIVNIDVAGVSGNTLTLATATKFSHPESTKITLLLYDQAKFYRTTTAAFSDVGTELANSPVNIQADSLFTVYEDTTNTTGFGWFKFYNANIGGGIFSSVSNAMPYAGFAENSVRKIFDSFLSSINNSEQKLITTSDLFSWLNEAYAITLNELNLINKEYTVSAPYSVAVSAGTAEYALPSGFSNLISITDSNGDEISSIGTNDIEEYNNGYNTIPKYYIRGDYIGFAPTPTESATYTLRYQAKTTALTSYYDTVDLPTNNFYFIKDYMMFRAAPKLNRGDGDSFYQLFVASINRMKMIVKKREANLDSWTPYEGTNI